MSKHLDQGANDGDRDLLGCVVVFLVAMIGAILVMSHLDHQRAKQTQPSTPTVKVIE